MEMEKGISFRRESFRMIFYITVLVVSLFILNFIFGWSSQESIPVFLQPFSNVILFVNPFLPYVQAVLVLALGYLAVNTLSDMTYAYMRRFTDHPTAMTVKTIVKISGFAVLLSSMASLFNVSSAAALTIGSFGGLVVGFATQTILTHVVAGVFLLIYRPYTFGDVVTVAGQTGVVKNFRIMHLVLESLDGTTEILIPSGTVVTQIIQKKKPPQQIKPIKSLLEMENPPKKLKSGSYVTFAGRLLEYESRKPIPNAIVRIMESDVGKDDLIGSAVTDSEGRFTFTWRAKKMDAHDNTVEVYAKFEGNEDYQQSRSQQYIIEIEET